MVLNFLKWLCTVVTLHDLFINCSKGFAFMNTVCTEIALHTKEPISTNKRKLWVKSTKIMCNNSKIMMIVTAASEYKIEY